MYMYEHRMEKFREFQEKVAENNYYVDNHDDSKNATQKIFVEVFEDFRGFKGTVKINDGELTVRPQDFGWEIEIFRDYDVFQETHLIKVASENPKEVVAWIHDYLVDFPVRS